jgi:hypothetical protein
VIRDGNLFQNHERHWRGELLKEPGLLRKVSVPLNCVILIILNLQNFITSILLLLHAFCFISIFFNRQSGIS